MGKGWVNSCPGAAKVRTFPCDTRLILQTLLTIPNLLEYFLLPHIIPTIWGRKIKKKKKFLYCQSKVSSPCVSPSGFEMVILQPAFGLLRIMQRVLTRDQLSRAGGWGQVEAGTGVLRSSPGSWVQSGSVPGFRPSTSHTSDQRRKGQKDPCI